MEADSDILLSMFNKVYWGILEPW